MSRDIRLKILHSIFLLIIIDTALIIFGKLTVTYKYKFYPLPPTVDDGGRPQIPAKGTIRKFLKVVEVHIEGLRYPPICLFDLLFSCHCPFKGMTGQSVRRQK
jgi:hypothetical protein